MTTQTKSKETGLLMSTPMIQSYMAGLKTQTRRMRGLKKINENPDAWSFIADGLIDGLARFMRKDDPCHTIDIKSPWGRVGDLLWFKEKWSIESGEYSDFKDDSKPWPLIRYWADEDPQRVATNIKWYSSIHMHRASSRHVVPITDLRLERLQDITPSDARAEGAPEFSGLPVYHKRGEMSYVDWFKETFCSIHGPEIWTHNPWVWPISFPRYQP